MSKKKNIKIDDTKNSIVDDDFELDSDEEINILDEEYEKSFDDSDNCMINNMVEEDEDFFENDNDENYDNYEEKKKVVNPEDRISKNLLTNYELVRVLGERQKQLTLGAKPLVKNYGDLSYDEISILELKNGMLPFKIRRKINNNYEIWDITELKFDHLLSRLN